MTDPSPRLDAWRAPPVPARVILHGRSCRVEPLAMEHAAALHEANSIDAQGRMWDYLAYGPFDGLDAYRAWVGQKVSSVDPLFFAIVDRAGDAPVGVASYLRIDPPNGVIEVGHLAYSPRLQRTPAATEAMYLMMRHAFELGYRRYEWKCNARNEPSRSAAERLGFTFEGVFRQHMIVKGRSRDTAWYSVIDGEWPRVRAGFERWLDAGNFDAAGRQRRTLADCRMDSGGVS
ncbi:MAG TPA: GNAT family protein, partial [Steroidobacteraceae bacterium]|nr:GNAT family protein [Steroidobacteraceae bacterium]